MENKKKKKVQEIQQQEQEPTGSTEYIANHEIDKIIREGKDRLRRAINVSDEKLTRTKKEIVKEMAEDMEKANYPVNQICDRLAKSLPPLVSERTVRDALDSKYKNTEQSEVAKLQQNQEGGSLYRQQQQVAKKPVEQITLEDLKLADFPKSKLKQLAKHNMQKVLWLEQQDKQNKDKDKEQEPKAKTSAEVEPFTTEFTMIMQDYVVEDLLGIKLVEGKRDVPKYYYVTKIKAEVNPVTHKSKHIPPVIITNKFPVEQWAMRKKEILKEYEESRQ